MRYLFNKIIKTALKDKGITQRKMAEDLSINEGQLSHFLKHNKKMSFRKNIIRIYEYLDINLEIK